MRLYYLVGFMKRFFTDPHFLVALALGPCVWVVLYFLPLNSASSLDIIMLLTVCLMYPILEELAFRGFVQSWLLDTVQVAKKQLAGVSLANVTTSVIFAALHLFNQPPLWAAAVFFPSVVFGYFRERHDSVLPCIILHCWYNTGFFFVLS